MSLTSTVPTTINARPVAGDLVGASSPLLYLAAQGASNGAQPTYAATFQNDATQKFVLGLEVDAIDTVYGALKLKYLLGCANNVLGAVVCYDEKAGTTALVITTPSTPNGPLAVALSAPLATQYGWYVVKGQFPVQTVSAGTGAANSFLDITAVGGQLTVHTAGSGYNQVSGMKCTSAQGTPLTGFCNVQIDYPMLNGQP